MTDYALNFRYACRPQKPLLLKRLVPAVLQSALLGRPRLRYVDFAIDFACNLHCQHCFAASLRRPGRRRLRPEDYRRVAAECMELGAVNFSFQGGEPLLFPELGDIIRACQPARNLISVTTNGTLLTPRSLSELKHSGVDILTVSLDSSIAEEHDRFRGEIGAFAKTLSGIRLARTHGFQVTIGTVVTHQTLRSKGILGLIRLAQQLRVLLYLILPVPAGRWANHREVLLSEADLAYVDELTRRSPYLRTDLQANLGGYGCGAGKEILYVTPYGDVLPCPFLHLSFGNVSQESMGDIRARILQNSYFAVYYPKCLASADPEFIDRVLSKTFQADELPLHWDSVFTFEPPRVRT